MPVALHIPLHPPPQCQDNTTSHTKSPDKPRAQREGVRGWVGEEKCQHTWSSLSRRNPLSRYARRRGGEAKPTRNKVGLNRGEGSVS